MNIDDEQQFLQTAAIVLEGLQCFITQKMNQHIIYALLQIRKFTRKNRTSETTPADRKSNASISHKNYSERVDSSPAHSVDKSIGKQSQASFDIIKGAQKFNESRRRGIQQKKFTQRFSQQKEYMTRDNEQPTSFSQPYKKNNQPQTKRSAIVPKLVGLVSSQEISDIEQPFGTDSRDKKQSDFKNYQQSIEQVDDDDDQFQDIVLNRLDVIEQKVNQMLKQKKHQRLSTLSNRLPSNQSYYVSKSKLQNQGSGPNIIYSKQVNNNNLYQHSEARYPNSTGVMTPRVYTFQNSKNTSLHPSSQKITNRSFKQNFTDRIRGNPKQVNEQNYYTDNQQYFENQKIIRRDLNDEIYEEQPKEPQQIMNKNKILGHYRESSKTLDEPELSEEDLTPAQNIQKTLETTINYAKIKEQNLDGNAFKYIPLSKITNKAENPPQKTQRQISRRNHDQVSTHSNNVSYPATKNHVMMVQKPGRVFETSYQEHVDSHNGRNQIKEVAHRNNIRKDQLYRSGRHGALWENQLGGSGVKAYTEQGDFIQSEDRLSVSSQNNIYSQIRELRQITKLYGVERQRKNPPVTQKQNVTRLQYVEGMSTPQYEHYDYRHHQKTQRPKYIQSRNHTLQNQYQSDDRMVVEGNYHEEKLVRVIKQIPHYSPQIQVAPQRKSSQNSQYAEYVSREPVLYNQYENPSYNPVYVVRQRQGPVYERVQQVYQEGAPSSSEFQTVIMHDDSRSKISNRKLSSGSIQSFKSIPYVRVESNPPITKQRSVQYIVQRPVQYVQKTTYKDY